MNTSQNGHLTLSKITRECFNNFVNLSKYDFFFAFDYIETIILWVKTFLTVLKQSKLSYKYLQFYQMIRIKETKYTAKYIDKFYDFFSINK